eukprot:CAMPEP_0179070898 /NCGR_PEP_ID=MMETSP0796-20121207/31256_1 /TAXON_ID=73915 /ORGANISM="Pyrodinium bahamense, Strain pbaha01" /LENGTH=440 /DNA_ID=CAMNT_0020768001 /DNA_START=46 /DNA_END=1368 /DNA_ORIENTATION=-
MEGRLQPLGNTFLNFYVPVAQTERPVRSNSAPPYISLRSFNSSSESAVYDDYVDRNALSAGEDTCVVHNIDGATHTHENEDAVDWDSEDTAPSCKREAALLSCPDGPDNNDDVPWSGPGSWSQTAKAGERTGSSGDDSGSSPQFAGVGIVAEGSRPAGAIESATAPFARTASATPTTLMIQNLPHRLLQSELADEIDRSGFRGHYDFLYMPSVFSAGCGKGFAFVNFTSPRTAKAFASAWRKSCPFPDRSRTALSVARARIQGREANMARWLTPKMRRVTNPNFRPICSPEGFRQLSLTVPVARPPPAPAPPAAQAGCTAQSCGQPAMAAFLMVPVVWARPAAAAQEMALAQPCGVDGVGSNALGGAMGANTSAPQGEDADIVGKQCMIHGLVADQQYNGAWCHVESFDASMQRYAVRVLTTTSAPLRAKLRRENLSVVP